MKLWQKLSLTFALVLLAAMGLSGGLALTKLTSYYKEKTVESGVQQLGSAVFTLGRELESGTLWQYSETTRRAYLNYLLKRLDADAYMLYADGSLVCNLTSYSLEQEPDSLFDGGDSFSVIQKNDGQAVFICGKKLSYGKEYILLRIEDITAVYEDMSRLALYCGAVMLAVLCLAVGLIFIMTRRLLRPLGELQRAAAELGRGNMEQRVSVTSRDEIGLLAEEFNRMAAQLEEHVEELRTQSQRRLELLGSLTHELKTPMTAMIGYADSLLHVKLGDESRERALRYIYENGKRLGRLSGKLMALLGLYENDSITMSRTEVSDLFARVQEMEAAQLQQKGMTLVCRCEIGALEMDADLMESLLLNLIDNAMKASKEDDVIELTAAGGEISVRDHGCGIARDEVARVTEAFYMVDKARSRRQGGCGLGLALCSRIAALHGARLQIESEVGAGTKVAVVFEITKRLHFDEYFLRHDVLK